MQILIDSQRPWRDLIREETAGRTPAQCRLNIVLAETIRQRVPWASMRAPQNRQRKYSAAWKEIDPFKVFDAPPPPPLSC